MISYHNQDRATGRFDQVLRAALRHNLRGEEPPARVRESLLRAAAVQRLQPADRRPLKSNRPARTRRWAILSGLWRDSSPPLLGDMWVTIEVANAHVMRMRFLM